MPQAIILSLANPSDDTEAAKSDSCGIGGGCGTLCGGGTARTCESGPRVPILACRDALTTAGFEVELVTATSDQEIDAVVARLDGPAREDGLTWPSTDGPTLIAAIESDSQLRAIVRRMVRRYAPAPSKRPADVPDGRTLPDLPPLAILPMHHAADLADRLGLPRDGADVAKAVIGGVIRRLDLFRNDGGSITIHGALIGGVDASGQAAPWQGVVVVDDTTLSDGTEPLLACAVANADGYARLDEIALAPRADAASGAITLAVALPVTTRSRFGRVGVRVEVRRATGRAVSVSPRGDVPIVDDGVESSLGRKRSWWVEAGAWGVFTT
jgi:hypothetical protein